MLLPINSPILYMYDQIMIYRDAVKSQISVTKLDKTNPQ